MRRVGDTFRGRCAVLAGRSGDERPGRGDLQESVGPVVGVPSPLVGQHLLFDAVHEAVVEVGEADALQRGQGVRGEAE